MSEKNVKAFFEKMEGDKALLEKVGALHTKAKENLDGAIAELVKIAASAGFQFTANDYSKARSNKHEQPASQDISAAAKLGGCNSNWTCARVKTM
jgi:predicted ribosomally synthesized peptide with nif11-like leader